MIFWHIRKINNFDTYNVFLAIATNIPQRLKTGFVVQGYIHIYIYIYIYIYTHTYTYTHHNTIYKILNFSYINVHIMFIHNTFSYKNMKYGPFKTFSELTLTFS